MVKSVAFSPNGSQIVSGSWDGTIRIWDITTRAQISILHNENSRKVYSVAWNPDGLQIVSGDTYNTIKLWNIKTDKNDKKMLTSKRLGEIRDVSFTADGSQIVSAGGNGYFIRIWDVVTGQQVGESLTGHTDTINSIDLSPSSSWVVSGSDDGTIRLWDVATRQQIISPIEMNHNSWALSFTGTQYFGHSGEVMSVAFSPDGKIVVSGGSDTTIRLWDMDIESWIAKACQRAGRNLSLQEWQTYIGYESYQITCPQWPIDEDALEAMEN